MNSDWIKDGKVDLVKVAERWLGRTDPEAIEQRVDLDGCNWSCPCGSSTYTSDGWSYEADMQRLREWVKVHVEHSNGMLLSRVSADGMRALANNPGPQTRPLADTFPFLKERKDDGAE